jgi:hypothetical protein
MKKSQRRAGARSQGVTSVNSRNAEAQALRAAQAMVTPVRNDVSEHSPHVPSFLQAAASAQSQSASKTRDELIAEGAYLQALSRGFAPGHELEDWLTAEKTVDARLVGKYRE